MHPKSQESFQKELEILRIEIPSAEGPHSLLSCSLFLVRRPWEVSHWTEAPVCPLDHLLIGQHSFSHWMHWGDYHRNTVLKIGFRSHYRENHGYTDSQACRLQLTVLHFLTHHSTQNILTWYFGDFVYPSWSNDWILPRVSSQSIVTS